MHRKCCWLVHSVSGGFHKKEKCNSCGLHIHNSAELCSVTSISLEKDFIHKTKNFLVLKAHLSVWEDSQISFLVIALEPGIQELLQTL